MNHAENSVDSASYHLINACLKPPWGDRRVADKRLASKLDDFFVEMLDEIRRQRIAGRGDEQTEDVRSLAAKLLGGWASAIVKLLRKFLNSVCGGLCDATVAAPAIEDAADDGDRDARLASNVNEPHRLPSTGHAIGGRSIRGHVESPNLTLSHLLNKKASEEKSSSNLSLGQCGYENRETPAITDHMTFRQHVK